MVAKQILHQRLKEQRITADFIRSILVYNPITGIFRWGVKRGEKLPGDKAGEHTKRGYISITISGVQYRAHRLAWLYMTGSWPSGVIDHKDRNRSNNIWTNLRDTTQSVNSLNCDRSDRVKARRVVDAYKKSIEFLT